MMGKCPNWSSCPFLFGTQLSFLSVFQIHPLYLDPIYASLKLLTRKTQSSLRRPSVTGLIASGAENKHTGKHALMSVPSEACLLNRGAKLKQTGALKENVHASEHVDVIF